MGRLARPVTLRVTAPLNPFAEARYGVGVLLWRTIVRLVGVTLSVKSAGLGLGVGVKVAVGIGGSSACGSGPRRAGRRGGRAARRSRVT